MRNSAHDIRTFINSTFHQAFAIRERENALLGESHDLHIHEIAHLFAQFKYGMQSGQIGIRHIDMGAHVLDTVSGHQFQGAQSTVLDIINTERFLAFRPNANSIEQSSCFIPFRLSGSQSSIKMNMRVNKGRNHQATMSINDLLP